MTDTTEAGPTTAPPSGVNPDSTEGTSSSRGTGSVNPDYMSYSRMNSILTCGEQFRLERVLKMPSREHWASIGGNAFHSAVERILKSSLVSSEGQAI